MPRQMTIKLRSGIQFHSGRELTSQDLAWNFTRLKDPKVNPTYANLVKPFAALETPDKSTLRVQFDQPNPFVVDALPNLSIIDPVSFEQQGVTKPVGTGPFTFVEYVQGDHLTLRKNPNYWDKGKPYLDELRFRIFTDPQAMMTEFEAGTLDLALQPTLNDWVRVQKEARAQALINQNSGNYMGAAFNTTQPPTDNKLVRQALQFALDRQRIADTIWQGVERPLTLLWYPSSPAYDAAKNKHVCVRSGQSAFTAGAGKRLQRRARLQLRFDAAGLRPSGTDLAGGSRQDRREAHAQADRSGGADQQHAAPAVQRRRRRDRGSMANCMAASSGRRRTSDRSTTTRASRTTSTRS